MSNVNAQYMYTVMSSFVEVNKSNAFIQAFSTTSTSSIKFK